MNAAEVYFMLSSGLQGVYRILPSVQLPAFTVAHWMLNAGFWASRMQVPREPNYPLKEGIYLKSSYSGPYGLRSSSPYFPYRDPSRSLYIRNPMV